MSILFYIKFTTDDLDWMAEDAGVSIEVATERAESASRAITDTLIESGNELLLDAVRGVL